MSDTYDPFNPLSLCFRTEENGNTNPRLFQKSEF